MSEAPEITPEMLEMLEAFAEPEETETTFSLEIPEKVADTRELASAFARKVMRPAAAEWDRRGEFPWEIVQEAADCGLYGVVPLITAQKEKSGLLLPWGLVEPLFHGDAGLAMAIMGSGLAAAAINANGSFEQSLEWVPQCYGSRNDVKVGALCVSEPHAGSDVANMDTRAVYKPATDEWEITGNKEWITNGSIANVYVVVASVDPELKGRGQASFMVPAGTKGLTPGKHHDKLGIRASDTAPVHFDHVRIPGRNLLMRGGKEKLDERLAKAHEVLANPSKAVRSGGQPALATFEATRFLVAAMAVGVARAGLEYSLKYAKERHAFGEPIARKQLIAGDIADLATEIEAARLLVWQAAWMFKNGGFKHAEGSKAKLFAGRAVRHSTERAVQILGGAGFVKDHPVERWYRDAKIFEIFEGTEQIQQLVIAESETGERVR